LYQGEELGLPEVTELPDELRQDPAFFRTSADGQEGQDGQDGFRDGCRVPLPWTRSGDSYGFGPGGSWLPQPDAWSELSVEAQTGDPGSTLELYRDALALRRELPGLGDGPMSWLEAPAGVLALSRPGLVCTLNTLGEEVELPVPGRALLSSAPLAYKAGTVCIPPDSCAWWAI
ncbi:DUF3459 domain-containing protein, partial [Streptomyces albiflaviniger]|nr:DUF3459 domain-containing protein [Streptomyces albiflaviniger]